MTLASAFRAVLASKSHEMVLSVYLCGIRVAADGSIAAGHGSDALM